MPNTDATGASPLTPAEQTLRDDALHYHRSPTRGAI
jgi:hypothetical protein